MPSVRSPVAASSPVFMLTCSVLLLSCTLRALRVSYISGRWWRWKFRNVLAVVLLLICVGKSAVLSAVLSCHRSCHEVLTTSEGIFTSPCYPSDYLPSQSCSWTLQAPTGFIVQITFLDFELEEAQGCIYDRVVVNTGQGSGVPFCGLTANGLSLNSSGNVMVVSFISDFSVQKKGFSINYRQVAVALRNQKVTVPQNSKDVVKVSSSVPIPILSEFTMCFEISRLTLKGTEVIFSYTETGKGPTLSLGSTGNTMELTVGGSTCPVSELLAPVDITSQLQLLCLTWSTVSGRVAVNFRGNYRAKVCLALLNVTVASGGSLMLGAAGGTGRNFDGIIYNFRLWAVAMSFSNLSALTCDAVGNVVDWDNGFWDIPSSSAQTDTSLSCICYPHCIHLTTAASSSGTSTPATTSQSTRCPPGLGCTAALTTLTSSTATTNIPPTNATTNEKERAVFLWSLLHLHPRTATLPSAPSPAPPPSRLPIAPVGRSSKTSLGFISTPLIWPVRKKTESTVTQAPKRPTLHLTKPPLMPTKGVTNMSSESQLPEALTITKKANLTGRRPAYPQLQRQHNLTAVLEVFQVTSLGNRKNKPLMPHWILSDISRNSSEMVDYPSGLNPEVFLYDLDLDEDVFSQFDLDSAYSLDEGLTTSVPLNVSLFESMPTARSSTAAPEDNSAAVSRLKNLHNQLHPLSPWSAFTQVQGQEQGETLGSGVLIPALLFSRGTSVQMSPPGMSAPPHLSVPSLSLEYLLPSGLMNQGLQQGAGVHHTSTVMERDQEDSTGVTSHLIKPTVHVHKQTGTAQEPYGRTAAVEKGYNPTEPAPPSTIAVSLQNVPYQTPSFTELQTVSYSPSQNNSPLAAAPGLSVTAKAEVLVDSSYSGPTLTEVWSSYTRTKSEAEVQRDLMTESNRSSPLSPSSAADASVVWSPGSGESFLKPGAEHNSHLVLYPSNNLFISMQQPHNNDWSDLITAGLVTPYLGTEAVTIRSSVVSLSKVDSPWPLEPSHVNRLSETLFRALYKQNDFYCSEADLKVLSCTSPMTFSSYSGSPHTSATSLTFLTDRMASSLFSPLNSNSQLRAERINGFPMFSTDSGGIFDSSFTPYVDILDSTYWEGDANTWNVVREDVVALSAFRDSTVTLPLMPSASLDSLRSSSMSYNIRNTPSGLRYPTAGLKHAYSHSTTDIPVNTAMMATAQMPSDLLTTSQSNLLSSSSVTTELSVSDRAESLQFHVGKSSPITGPTRPIISTMTVDVRHSPDTEYERPDGGCRNFSTFPSKQSWPSGLEAGGHTLVPPNHPVDTSIPNNHSEDLLQTKHAQSLTSELPFWSKNESAKPSSQSHNGLFVWSTTTDRETYPSPPANHHWPFVPTNATFPLATLPKGVMAAADSGLTGAALVAATDSPELTPYRCKDPFPIPCLPGRSAGNKAAFYRISLSVMEHITDDTMTQWFNQTFQNWNYTVYVRNVSVHTDHSSTTSTRYTCKALLMYINTTGKILTDSDIEKRLRSASAGELLLGEVTVDGIENCQAEENPFHYKWPESRASVTQYIPCFPYKEQNASRTCLISSENYTSFWDVPDLNNCKDIEDIDVSDENAAEVAVQLVDITNNELSTVEVSKVVTMVKKLVNVARINATLASSVVAIISNVMISSDSAQLAASETALKTMDELVQKIEFDGPSLTITSKNLAVGISTLNISDFNGTTFSAYIPANSTDPQINFESEIQNPLASVKLPATLLINLSNSDMETVSRINFMFFSRTGLFRCFGSLMEQQSDGLSLSSYVVASSVGNLTISNLRDPVRIEISHLQYQWNPKPLCVFWDFTLKSKYGTGGWNREGCMVDPESNSNRTVCLCNHLTHFGVLMDISGAAAQIDEKNTKILTFITYIGCGISAIFTAVTILTYIAFEKLRRDYPSKILMNLSSSLLFLNMVFLLDGWLASSDTTGLCVAVAVFLHFFLLTSFTWMGLESLHMYIALVKVFNTYIRRYILKFCIVGWGLPAVVVGIVVAIDKDFYGKEYYAKGESGHSSSEFCWIKNKVVFYVTCVVYFSVIFLMNVAMFIVVMMQICGRSGKRSNRTLRDEVLRNLRSVVSLTFLLGLTWGFAFFAWGPVNLAFIYLFSIFNSLQGLFIFIFHCALKENVQKQWRRYLCCGKLHWTDNSDWSKTATNNTKKVSSDNLGKSLSSSSFCSTTANWTSKAKATLNPFAKHHSSADNIHH
ncbi:adhesion G-protein coupled receptor G6 isoform X1 [Electrophorus electricus]|uniref:adhesion G-protein coupled receptor G6 isoform X1 n=1 Tax=Electrophorus electricus TaxID=8005 RepID=UPI0015CFEB10|nr:adhesion G-protein coupled receptor G6 isoform X1 [Electrophorus electricus]